MLARIFALIRVLWLSWFRPPETLEQIVERRQKADEFRLREIDDSHRRELADFDQSLHHIWRTKAINRSAWTDLDHSAALVYDDINARSGGRFWKDPNPRGTDQEASIHFPVPVFCGRGEQLACNLVELHALERMGYHRQ